MSESDGWQTMERDRPGSNQSHASGGAVFEATNHTHFILLPCARISAHGNCAARHGLD